MTRQSFYFVALVTLLTLTGCNGMRKDSKQSNLKNNVAFHSTHTADNPMFQNTVAGLGNGKSQKTEAPFAKSRKRDSQKLAHHALSAVLSNDKLSQTHVQIVSYFGNLLVVGEVHNTNNIDLTKEILQEVDGVQQVALELRPQSNNSVRQQINDSKTTTQVKKQLHQLGVSFSHLQPITNAGVVYILGPASSEDKSQITQTLHSIPSVRSVRFF